MRKKSMLRRVLLPVALVIGVSAVAAPGAQATLREVHYGGFLMAAHYQYTPECCITDPTRTTGNIAAYLGSGTVPVCQRTYDLNTHTSHEGCANNNVGNALNLMPYYGHFLSPGIVNNSGAAHTIDGWAYDGTP